MNPLLVEEQRKEIIHIIGGDPKLTNRAIGNMLSVPAKKVSATRRWLNKKGEDVYLAETESKIAEMKTYVNGLFSNHSGVGKRTARKKMVEHIGATDLKKGQVLTLPADTWAIEALIQETVSKRFGYTACEKSIEVFPLMAAKIAWYGVKSRNEAFHGTTTQKIYEAKEDTYDHMLLDYCGILDNFGKEIIHACNANIVKKGGIIAITLTKAHCTKPWVSKVNNLKTELTGEAITSHPNSHAYPMFFKFLTSITDFEVVETFDYCDTTPMTLVVLKRTV